MNNRKVCEYISKISEREYLADLCVKQGYGQSCGGYLTSYSKDNSILTRPSEKMHFLNYYGNEKNAERNPTYYYLRCPQLLLFIAEIAGISKHRLDKAYNILKKYEDENMLRSTEKNGNYIWGKQEFRDFKAQLQINAVAKIIRVSMTWDEVKAEVANL